ncbi:hypothetical protein [Pseudoalteromonas prydzensis]|uniref:hypothetical protein n=1 Tax=Pseudoalteromonas prydzensis TaxID=182141 RepID=UPI000AED4497|nr:hypothetical protein [Pseudoalteromonas prydzensis]MBE0379210.1 hypothetical protein [Pseudoalteromonas prydzensis ACAM 620]
MTEFEQATLETLVSFKAKDQAEIKQLLTNKKLKKEACALVKKWNDKRKQLGLIPWE